MDGLPLAPDVDPLEKIRQLEDQVCRYFLVYKDNHASHPNVAQLKTKLFEQQNLATPVTSGHSTSHPPSMPGISDVPGISLPHASLSMMNLINRESGDLRSESKSPDAHSAKGNGTSESFMDLLFLGWNPDLPDPQALNH